MRIGALTIGQAPRDDVAPEFLDALTGDREIRGRLPDVYTPVDIELVQAGALDELSRTEIDALAPSGPDRRILVTRLRDGSEVKLDEAKIFGLLQAGIGRLEARGVSVIAMFCTGEFPEFSTRVPILRPDRILAHFVASVAHAGEHICVVVPSPSQSEMMAAKWAAHGHEVRVESLSPYTSSQSDWRLAALRVAETKPELVILDCIGYSRAMKAEFVSACGCPVILPRTLLGRAAAELSGI